METLKTIGIRDLKNNLSAYLREVRRGVRIFVTDRNTIVAELHEPLPTGVLTESVNPVLSEWIRAGVVRPIQNPKKKLPQSPLKLQDGISTKLIEEERGEARQ